MLRRTLIFFLKIKICTHITILGKFSATSHTAAFKFFLINFLRPVNIQDKFLVLKNDISFPKEKKKKSYYWFAQFEPNHKEDSISTGSVSQSTAHTGLPCVLTFCAFYHKLESAINIGLPIGVQAQKVGRRKREATTKMGPNITFQGTFPPC